jgi:CMP-N-acetylneuraminic acid synthetase
MQPGSSAPADIVAFLPCRAGSERVPHKNTRPFAGDHEGLIGIKLRQLIASRAVKRIVLSSNDPLVIEVAHRYAQQDKPLDIIERPAHLCTSSTSTDELIAYVPNIIRNGIVLWTHVTSPLVGAMEYDQMAEVYWRGLEAGHDSLMSVTELRTFLWTKEGPLNYDRRIEKWPRTQTLEPVYVVNSAAFMIDVALMQKLGDRVGAHPAFYCMGETISYEIDWEEQFAIAEGFYSVRR